MAPFPAGGEVRRALMNVEVIRIRTLLVVGSGVSLLFGSS